MEQLLAKYMKYGKLVKDNQTGAVYKFIDDMDKTSAYAKAVNMDAWNRYKLLAAWLKHWEKDPCFRARFTGNIQECKKEHDDYEEEIQVCDVSAANQVRFVTTDGYTKFIVNDLDVILVNGIRAMVVYLDETHFTFGTGIEMSLYGDCFHIYQFAVFCKEHSVKIERIEPRDNMVEVHIDQLNPDHCGDFVKCTD